MTKRLLRILRFVLLFGVAVWGLTLIAVVALHLAWPRAAPDPAPADAIVCLGAGVVHSMGAPRADPSSLRRALTCGRLQVAGVAPVVVFTGGTSGQVSAGAMMAQAAEATGFEPRNALIETASMSTIQNAAYSMALLPEDTARIVVVSDAFHLPRAWLIFRAFGVPEVALYAADPVQAEATDTMPAPRPMASWLLRETLAIWFNAARAATYVAGGWVGIDEATRVGWFN